MTTRRLPRSARGRALPRARGTDTVAWPPGLRGRSTLLTVLLLGWLGGGLTATAVATVTDSPNDLAYGLTNVTAALVGLLLLVLVRPRGSHRRAAVGAVADEPVPVPVPVPVPAQTEPQHDGRREPAVH